MRDGTGATPPTRMQLQGANTAAALHSLALKRFPFVCLKQDIDIPGFIRIDVFRKCSQHCYTWLTQTGDETIT